jgi:hypothetical protein
MPTCGGIIAVVIVLTLIASAEWVADLILAIFGG